MTLLKKIKKAIKSNTSQPEQYRFLVKKWRDISDINLAANVLSTDYFKLQIKMVPIPLEKFKSYLILSPHQDDETIGAGGTMLLAQKYKPKIDIAFITDGSSKTDIFSGDVEVRRKEALKVAKEINADIHEIGINNEKPKPTKEHLAKMAELIIRLKPDVILIPWLLDFPTKHRLTNHLFWMVDKLYNLPDCEVWGYQVHNDMFPNNYVDITSVIDEKVRLMRYYESQNKYIQRYDHLLKGMAIWNSRFIPSDEERYYEVFFSVPLKEYTSLVGNFYFKNLTETYRGEIEVYKEIEVFHNSLGFDL